MKCVSYLILHCVASLTVPVMQKAHVFAASSFAQTKALDFLCFTSTYFQFLYEMYSGDADFQTAVLVSKEA